MGQNEGCFCFFTILFSENQQKCFTACFIPCDESGDGLAVGTCADREDVAMAEFLSVIFVKIIHLFQDQSAFSTDF